MPKAAEIQRNAIAGAKLQDSLSARFVRDLDSALKNVNRQIRRLVLQLDSEGGRLVSTKANLGRALRLRSDILTAIEASGFSALATKSVDAPLDELAARVLKGRSIAAQAARLTPVDIDALVALKELQLADLLEIGDDAATSLQKGVLNGVLGGRPIADLVDDLEDVLDVTNRQARTVYDTALGTYTRQVNLIGTTGKPDELFMYAGPTDSLARPFCRNLVGRVLTRAAISDLSNGQLPNVLLTGGGYNCRHVWQPVSDLDDELQDLAQSGERLPSIEAQVAA